MGVLSKPQDYNQIGFHQVRIFKRPKGAGLDWYQDKNKPNKVIPELTKKELMKIGIEDNFYKSRSKYLSKKHRDKLQEKKNPRTKFSWTPEADQRLINHYNLIGSDGALTRFEFLKSLGVTNDQYNWRVRTLKDTMSGEGGPVITSRSKYNESMLPDLKALTNIQLSLKHKIPTQTVRGWRQRYIPRSVTLFKIKNCTKCGDEFPARTDLKKKCDRCIRRY